MRAIVYIDGFNLYYGLLRHSPHKLKKVTVVFNPHEGECHELRRFSTFCKNIPRELPSQCRLPDEVHVGKRVVTCPLSWRISG